MSSNPQTVVEPVGPWPSGLIESDYSVLDDSYEGSPNSLDQLENLLVDKFGNLVSRPGLWANSFAGNTFIANGFTSVPGVLTDGYVKAIVAGLDNTGTQKVAFFDGINLTDIQSPGITNPMSSFLYNGY